jgi:hypothetical protein
MTVLVRRKWASIESGSLQKVLSGDALYGDNASAVDTRHLANLSIARPDASSTSICREAFLIPNRLIALSPRLFWSSTMAPIEKRTCTVKRGFKYTYLAAKAEASKLTIIFLHGFVRCPQRSHSVPDVQWQPESKYCYRHVLPFFAEKGFGVICPDLLGYDEVRQLACP